MNPPGFPNPPQPVAQKTARERNFGSWTMYLRATGVRLSVLLLAVGILVVSVNGQFPGRGRRSFRGGGSPSEAQRGNIPEWELRPAFARDCFTFVRIKYRSTDDRTSRAWWTDYPDADLNFSWRLHQTTSLKVDPTGKVIDLMDPELFRYPFAFMSGVPAIVMEVYDGQTPHYRGISDANGRLMMLICHNTDLGDGWEEEGTDPDYFLEFSEPKAYPLGINIIFYVLTH